MPENESVNFRAIIFALLVVSIVLLFSDLGKKREEERRAFEDAWEVVGKEIWRKSAR